jgi:FkbM family methyltransferase
VSRTLILSSDRGRDQIAMELATHGWNSFEYPAPDVVSSLAQVADGSFFDVGANSGLYALLAASASKQVKIHAFEPYPPAIDALRKNIALNHLVERITLCRSALSDKAGKQSLYIPLQDHGLLESSASLNAGFKTEHSSVLDIDATTIDDYVLEFSPIRLGLLKIDVESTEHQVLAGGMKTIGRDRPLIVLEVLHLADHPLLDTFCRENNYRIFTMHPQHIQIRDTVAFHGDAWNQCFCPEEKLPVLRGCAEKIGIQFSG